MASCLRSWMEETLAVRDANSVVSCATASEFSGSCSTRLRHSRKSALSLRVGRLG